VVAVLLGLLVAAVLAGCGGAAEDRPDRDATLVLDFRPNAVHAGIYLAVEREFDRAEGVNLDVKAPSSSSSSVNLLVSGRAQLAILDIHDLASARADGRDVVGVMALVQRPLPAAVEGVAIRARRRGTREPRVDEHGAPGYPQLLLCATRRTVQDDPAIVRAAVRALRRGYSEALADPESAIEALLDRAGNRLGRRVLQRQFDALQGAFTASPGGFGVLDPARLRAWARWERRYGGVRRAPNVAQAFAPELSRG
jgi:ABC-type nitrate/sulfonate/bicarbonate transport system substrate-binding protein